MVLVAAHGLSLVMASGGYSFVMVHGLLFVVASLIAGAGQKLGLAGSRAQAQ